jgi:hypothetical protein
MTLDQAMQPEAPAPAKRKISIGQQIEEAELELKFRRDVFPRQIMAGKMRQGEADYRTARMEAICASLIYLQTHEEAIKGAVEIQAAARSLQEENEAMRARIRELEATGG